MNDKEYQLTLYVIGHSSRSQVAVKNTKSLCERYLTGRYMLRVVDLLEHPEEAEKQKVLASPMLLKMTPPPEVRIIGDLSDASKVLSGLDIVTEETMEPFQHEHKS